jgi:hypothetical protein
VRNPDPAAVFGDIDQYRDQAEGGDENKGIDH